MNVKYVEVCIITCKENPALKFEWFMSCVIPRVDPGCVLCPRIDPLHFLAGCHRRRPNQGLVVALGFFSLDRA